MITPDSPQLQAIWTLFTWSIGVGTAIFLLVTGLVLYAAFRFRHRGDSDAEEPRQIAGNTRLEIAWTVIPALILVGFFIPTVIVLRETTAPPADDTTQAPDIVLRGYQWWWRVEYAEAGVVSANEIHIPIGQRLLVRLEAEDVMHNFWVPDLVPKQYMIPGRANTVWLQADQPGVYRGVCAEYCGVQHAKMLISVVAHPADEYEAWLAEAQQIQPAALAGLAAEGEELYNQLTCVNCHAIGTSENAALAGPNLANFGGRLTIGAGAAPNTPEHLAQWLADPGVIKPGVYMPGYSRSLDEEQIAALVAYLGSLQ